MCGFVLRPKRSLFVRFCTLLVAGTLVTSCTKSISVPPSSYEQVNSEQAKYWRVKTTDDQTYWVEVFTITDSTLVIEQASQVYESQNSEEARLIERSELPIKVPLSDVAALERREISIKRTALVLLPFGIAFVALYVYAKSFEAFGHLN